MKFIQTSKLKRIFALKRPNLKEPNSSRNDEEKIETFQLSRGPIWKSFSFQEILAATDGFSSENLVGRGGNAEVYRGILENGEEIAVKKQIKSSNEERSEREFLTEIGTMGHANHPNILSLLGCCIDNGLHLIFHFSANGSVSSLLHGEKTSPLGWKTRYKIAIGTARGLTYLHKGCQRRIIHRDIKSSNILLTSDYEPLISDFGLAKWLPSQCSHYSIAPIEGTFGYLAPEYSMHGIVDEKTDVFAFGVLLLELLSGRRPADGSHQSLHCWAKPMLKEGEIEKLLDKRLGEEYDLRQVKQFALAASLCVQSLSTKRPTMNRVLEIMEKQENPEKERWETEEEEEEDELWSFENLEYESDSSFSTAHHSI